MKRLFETCSVVTALYLAGCASPGAASRAAPRPKFEHVQFSATIGGLMFFDQDTGELWAYSDPQKPPELLLKLEKLGKPMAGIPPARETADDTRATPAAPIALPKLKQPLPSEPNATAVVNHFNQLPKELWPSENETDAVRQARSDWLAKAHQPTTETVTGIISDVSSTTIDGQELPDGTIEYRKVPRIELDGGKVRVWGKDVNLEVWAIFDSVPVEEGLKWKKGQRIRISGKVQSAEVNTGIFSTRAPLSVSLG